MWWGIAIIKMVLQNILYAVNKSIKVRSNQLQNTQWKSWLPLDGAISWYVLTALRKTSIQIAIDCNFATSYYNKNM